MKPSNLPPPVVASSPPPNASFLGKSTATKRMNSKLYETPKVKVVRGIDTTSAVGIPRSERSAFFEAQKSYAHTIRPKDTLKASRIVEAWSPTVLRLL